MIGKRLLGAGSRDDALLYIRLSESHRTQATPERRNLCQRSSPNPSISGIQAQDSGWQLTRHTVLPSTDLGTQIHAGANLGQVQHELVVAL